MSLRNSPDADLTVTQIAAHLHARPWTVTRDLQLGRDGEPGRLIGRKVFREGAGRGGQWRVVRADYFARLGISDEDTAWLGPDGLPELTPFPDAAASLGIPEELLNSLVRQCRWPHITFGRSRYLTHNQLERIRVLADDEQWASRLAARRPGFDLPDRTPVSPGAPTGGR